MELGYAKNKLNNNKLLLNALKLETNFFLLINFDIKNFIYS